MKNLRKKLKKERKKTSGEEERERIQTEINQLKKDIIGNGDLWINHFKVFVSRSILLIMHILTDANIRTL